MNDSFLSLSGIARTPPLVLFEHVAELGQILAGTAGIERSVRPRGLLIVRGRLVSSLFFPKLRNQQNPLPHLPSLLLLSPSFIPPGFSRVSARPVPQVEIPDRFPELEDLPQDSKEYLLQDSERLHDIMFELEIIQTKKGILVDLLENNATIAKTTLEKESKIEELGAKLEEK